MLSNPYASRPDYAFWRRVMAGRQPCDVDPVTPPPFTIARSDRVATAGSCFAQHISRTLVQLGFSYLVTEAAPVGAEPNVDHGTFPARFGNLYTARQLLQLFHRAYGLFEPRDVAWRRQDGRLVDPFRPSIAKSGFGNVGELLADRDAHLRAVREMFECCDVFIFTLGLTEAWMSRRDGAVFPLAPGVLAAPPEPDQHAFHNFSVAEVEADLLSFVDGLRVVNPGVRVVLTVSPVALVATNEERHVLVSTTYSKAVLRVAAETASRARPDIAYFPSYEIITGPHGSRGFYREDLREVRPEAIAYVMSLFARHYLADCARARVPPAAARSVEPSADEVARIRETEGVICDEADLDVAP